MHATTIKFDPEFQFLGRNSGRSDLNLKNHTDIGLNVSIPRSEFWSFGPPGVGVGTKVGVKFQFLGRNSGRSDQVFPLLKLCFHDQFQFLGRNSGRSDPFFLSAHFSGKWLFQFLGRNSGRSDPQQLPRQW